MNVLILLLLPFFSLNAASTLIEDKTTLPFLNPALQDQSRLKIKLENGLQAVLISDPDAKQSTATLTVLAGSFQDPNELPGMAHFLEHMLFLGTSEYPVESEFGKFIAEHGGQTNAFTHSDYTSYMFSINQGAFEEALKRFASFFKTPLFNPSGVDRELNAIDQEFAQSFNNEPVRQYHVLKALARKDHPISRFQSGNSKSLKNGTTDDLKKWFNEHYSANIMRLVVYSSLPLEQLKTLVEEDFGGIENKQKSPPTSPYTVFPENIHGKLLLIESKKNQPTLTLIWELPKDIPPMLDSKPDDLLCYIIGHEGKGSLLQQLKSEGLAEKLGCGSLDLGTNASLFEIEIQLTVDGVILYEKVIERVFQALQRIKSGPLPETLFNDYKQILSIRYQFLEQEEPFNLATQHGSLLPREPIETYPELSYTIQSYNDKAFQELINSMNPEKALYVLTLAEKQHKVPLKEKEPWMDVSYQLEPIKEETLKKWGSVLLLDTIQLPSKNRFIPSSLNIKIPSSKKADYPNIEPPITLLDQNGALIYYREDPFYKIPRSFAKFQIQSPQIKEGSAQSVVLTDIYIKGLEEHLNELSYEAKMADLSLSLDRVSGSIQITLEGFTDSFEAFFPIFSSEIANFQLSAEKFLILKDALKRDYENNAREMPVKQTFDLFKAAVFEKYVTYDQKKNAIKNIHFDRFQDFQEKIISKTFIKGLLTGTLAWEKALTFVKTLTNAIQKGPTSFVNPTYTKVIDLQDKGPFFYEAKSKAKGDALLLAIEIPGYSPELRNCQQLLGLAIDEAFFTELRTKQQTGYIVTSDAIDLQKHLFTYFAVQSNTHTTNELLWRFEQFIENYLQEITSRSIPEKRFITLKETLFTKLKEPPATLNIFGELLFKLAFEVEDFSWIQKRVDLLTKLDYQTFVAFTKDSFGRSNKRRLAIFLNGLEPIDEAFNYQPLKKLKVK